MSSQQGSRQGMRYERAFCPAQTLLATDAHDTTLRSPIPLLEVTS